MEVYNKGGMYVSMSQKICLGLCMHQIHVLFPFFLSFFLLWHHAYIYLFSICLPLGFVVPRRHDDGFLVSCCIPEPGAQEMFVILTNECE